MYHTSNLLNDKININSNVLNTRNFNTSNFIYHTSNIFNSNLNNTSNFIYHTSNLLNDRILNLDASQVISGIFNIARIPT